MGTTKVKEWAEKNDSVKKLRIRITEENEKVL